MSATTTIQSVDKVLNLLKVIKYCSQYQRLQDSVAPEILDEAWQQLEEPKQRQIIDIINENIQPTPKAVAEEMLLCQSKEELLILKAEFGPDLSKEAWLLLSIEQRLEINEICAAAPAPAPASTPSLAVVPDSKVQEKDTSSDTSPEPEPSEPEDPERTVAIQLDLSNLQPETKAKPEGESSTEDKPIKSKGLIELSEEEEELKEIIEGILEDTEGRIPPELADAFDELLSRKVENDKQLKVKIDNYCAVMKHLSDWADVRFKEAERLKAIAEKDLALAKVLETRLKVYLEASGKIKIKTKRFNPRVCKNGGKTPIKLNVAVENLPQKYKVKKELINADFETLREALESGEELSFASLGERGTHLRYT